MLENIYMRIVHDLWINYLNLFACWSVKILTGHYSVEIPAVIGEILMRWELKNR
jgi:hypothetical protein